MERGGGGGRGLDGGGLTDFGVYTYNTPDKKIILTLISVKVHHFSLGLKTVPEKKRCFFVVGFLKKISCFLDTVSIRV